MKKAIGMVLLCILLIGALFFAGRPGATEKPASVAEAAAVEQPAGRNLRISVVHDIHAGFTTIPLEQGNYKDISYLDVCDVTIELDGISMKLEDALLNGDISVDELIACARQDASLGFCREIASSKNGLAVFTYYYGEGEFKLRHVYDIYETPDGGQHLVTDILIYGAWSEPHFTPVDQETGEIIDYENWGLRFDIARVDPSGITVACSQSGGQQMGELNINWLLLYRKAPNTLELELVEPLVEDGGSAPLTGITMGGETELSFDFAGLYGELPAGDYVLSLQMIDCYDKEKVPSLMRNYYDAQWYDIEFTIE